MSVAINPARQLTAEDLLDPAVPEKFVELVEGELVAMTPADWRHNRIASEFEFLFREHCKNHPSLDYGGDNDGFLIARNPDSVLSPDASLFHRREHGPSPWREFSPELVVEIRSPANSPSDLALKRHRYFDAGTEQFWLVYPEETRMEIYHRNGTVVSAEGEAVLEGEGIAAGMQIELREVFRER